MAIVTEISWNDMFAGQALPDSPARTAFREAVEIVAAHAREKLPEAVNGRIEAADGWCKHHIAMGIFKRATALAKEHLARLDAASHDTTTPTDQPTTEVLVPVPTQEPVATPALPEAASSANVFLTIKGRKIQFTLRDHDEENLLSRMERLLARFPSEEEPESAPTSPENLCPIHQVSRKRYSNAKGSWFAHKTANDAWCNGKNGKGK